MLFFRMDTPKRECSVVLPIVGVVFYFGASCKATLSTIQQYTTYSLKQKGPKYARLKGQLRFGHQVNALERSFMYCNIFITIQRHDV